jgi:hypothetical protein
MVEDYSALAGEYTYFFINFFSPDAAETDFVKFLTCLSDNQNFSNPMFL